MLRVNVYLEDGPRIGAELTLEAGPDGRPPTRLVVSDPLSDDPEHTGGRGTAYHLHELDEERGAFVYRTGASGDR